MNKQVKELIELDKKHFIHPATNPKELLEKGTEMIFSKGKGIYVTNSINEKKYIDGMSMLWNVNVGHGEQRLVNAAKEQMEKIAYSSTFKGYSNKPAIKLAAKLATLAPGDLNSVFFTSGGSESNDSALKLTRFYWGLKGKPEKRKFISLGKGYHGVTLAAQTATAIPAFHDFAGSFIDGFFHAMPHELECELGDKSHPNYKESIRGIIEREGSDTIAGIILEPVQGAGGVNIPPEGYMQAVRDICDEYDILMMADEIITGFGRTGKMFGVENWDVVPDTMSIAKGLTSGYAQLGGVMVNDEIKNTIDEYESIMAHGFTYSGHPTACAVGLENIKIIEQENIVDNVKEMEGYLNKKLKELEEKYFIVTNVRNIGLLAAFELYENPKEDKLFDKEVLPANEVVKSCFERELILRAAGAHNHIVAIAPPLTVTKKEIDKIMDIVDEAISVFVNKTIKV